MKKRKEPGKIKRRDFLKKAGVGAAAVATTAGIAGLLGCGKEEKKEEKTTIKWRMQTYAGPALSAHVCKPAIDAFNKVANGEMVIELYNADQLVPTGELFRAMQKGTIDAVQSDDDSIAAPVDVSVFGAYFPFASRYSLDVPVLWNWYGLNEIWEEAFSEVKGVTWLSVGAWDPCNFATTKPIRHLEDLKGLRVFSFPTGGRFMQQFGVVPMSLPWEDIEMAVQTGELDGVAWSGITEDYTVGWPEHLKTLFRLQMDSSHYYRQHWYWWGEAHYRTKGGKLELTSIPAEEWKVVEDAALKLWDDVAKKSPRSAKVVKILKEYAQTMKDAGPPYRY